MSRAIYRLSAKAVEKTKEPGYHCDGGGLYLQVSPTQSKSWIFRYKRHAKSHEMGLGSVSTVSLAEARTKASELRQQLVKGVDPITAREGVKAAERLKAANAITFHDCAKQYIAAHRAGWRNEKHVEQWENTLKTYAQPVFGTLSVKDIDTTLVLRVLEPIWTKKPETASRLRGRIERVLDWAKTRGYRDGDNPARWRGHLVNLLAKALNRKRREHHAALPYGEIGGLIEELRRHGSTAARALEFTILTAGRTQEVIGASNTEIDYAKAIWTIPAERMKGGKEHRVPLAPRALAIAKAQPEGAYLFPSPKPDAPLSNMAMLELLRRMGRDDLTVHGFRSTFRDWAAESTAYPREVCEMALAHAIGSKVEAAYRRGDLFDKRRNLMNEWANHCEHTKVLGKVSPIRKRAPVAA